jgi:phenylacetate-CoA ligase
MQTNEPVVFPRFLPEHALLVRDLHGQMIGFQTQPIEAQRRTQAAQLARLLDHAARTSVFWRDRIAAAGIDPARFDNLGDLARLPVLSRDDLVTHADAMRARTPGMTDALIHTGHTSGSTGKPVRVERFLPVYAPLYQAADLVDGAWHGRDARKTLGRFWALAADVDNGHWGPPAEFFGPVGKAFSRDLRTHRVEALYDTIRLHRPAYMLTTPTAVRALSECALADRDPPRIEQFVTSGEVVDDATRLLAHRAFGAKVADRYSCEECGWLALQCPRHDHYHVMSATTVIELLDERGHPCVPGETGRVVVTSLHSYAMPLIRYELGDLAVAGPACDCGVTLPVLSRIVGRTRNVLRLPDGSRRVVIGNAAFALKDLPVLEQQLRQYACGTLEFALRATRPLMPAEHERIRGWLLDQVDGSLPVVVTETAEVSWGALEKRKELVAVDRPYAAAPS